VLNGTLGILLEGELDLAEVEGVEKELAKAERSAAERIVIDLSGLTFIDSSGIAFLVAAAQRSSQDSDRLRLKRSKAPAVERTLMVTGLADRLPFLD
jgi:anti-anti-sigma factor